MSVQPRGQVGRTSVLVWGPQVRFVLFMMPQGLMSLAKAYKYEEYTAESETVPDMLTTYKTHNVVVTIKA